MLLIKKGIPIMLTIMKTAMKIISGGQTGVDRAALDAARALRMEYGGFVPKGRKAEDGPIPMEYGHLKELETDRYEARTERNVIEAAATLIFAMGALQGGTAITAGFARRYGKPCLVLDLMELTDEEAAARAGAWLSETRPEVLNVAGPRESNAPGIYGRVLSILKQTVNPRGQTGRGAL